MSTNDSNADMKSFLLGTAQEKPSGRDLDECACGDYRYQHRDGHGKCKVCGDSRAPYDGCTRFRLSRANSAA